MDAPSMVQRSGDTLIVRSVVSGDTIFLESKDNENEELKSYSKCSSKSITKETKGEVASAGNISLPQCKIKRNYSCNSCAFFTQNPRHFLTHLRDIHGEKIVINECKLCLYASRHYQKLVRHMKMVHGSTVGIEEQPHNRKRQPPKDGRKRKSVDRSRNHIIKRNFTAEIDRAEVFPIFEEPQLDDSFDNLSLKCRVCDFVALHKAQLSEHEEEEHGTNKIFRCEKCNYVTHLKARFSKHVKYHSMPMIKCMTCDFRTPYKWNLDRHMKNHGGSGPFKCVACNFTADIKQSLTVHEMNHHIPPVGNSSSLNFGRKKNKMGSTEALDDICSENEEFSDNNNNNSSNNNKNNNENALDSYIAIAKLEDKNEQPTDLSQKSYPQLPAVVAFKKTNRPVPNLIPIQTTTNLSRNLSLREIAPLFFCDDKLFDGLQAQRETEMAEQTHSSNSSLGIYRKKNENFFDKLKETSATLVSQHENLSCACGHVSKCLSESLIHQKSCTNAINGEKNFISPPINLFSNRMSTRCQFCRHRCKSSTDLAAHILKCDFALHEHQFPLDQQALRNLGSENAPHPMENKVFVWNEISAIKDEEDNNNLVFTTEEKSEVNLMEIACDELRESNGRDYNENGYFGVETAPGYGEVTKKMTAEEEATNSSLKKVYKCPHCSFWASTASRFHVHIVGHLNKKPFECSLCNYRSNWRWDITKHIRLKTIRDPTHKNAKVLMNDETGRRNYTKYNKYITLMKVTEEDGDPKLLKSGAMTPNQEASLAFLNDPRCKFGDNDAQGGKDLSYVANNNQFFSSTIDSHQEQANTVSNTKRKNSASDMNKSNFSDISQRNSLEDLLLNDEDIKHDIVEKKTTYKCKKCSYRNPAREAVLSHVKEHYHEPESKQTRRIPFGSSTDFYMKNVLASMCLLPQPLRVTQGDDCSNTMLSFGTSPSKSCVQNECLEQTNKINDSTSNVKKAGGPTVAVIDHGETDEASSGVVTTSGTGVSGWRSPAPFRCGHCHQVSNWKHVIQRHCRLKHNGDIRIETIDRASKKSSPEYFAIFPQSNNSGVSGIVSNASSTNCTVITVNNVKYSRYKTSSVKNCAPYCDTSISSNNSKNKSNGSICNIEENERNEKFHGKQDDLDDIETKCSSIENPNLDGINRTNFKTDSGENNIKYSYVSEDIKQGTHGRKSGLQNCELDISNGSKEKIKADYNKRHKFCSDELIQNFSEDLKVLSFCKFCPARFIGDDDLQLHLQTHYASFPYRCNSCSYTASQESYLAAHSEVHSTNYNEKTEKLLEIFTINPEFRRPGLTQICIPDTETIWIVNEFALSLEENASHSTSECYDNRKIFKTSPCLYCPFESNSPWELEVHMKHHYSVSKNENPKKCCHCDFSAADDDILKDHIRLHFKRLFWPEKNLIKCYTAYNSLKLMVTQRGDEKSSLKEVLYDSEIASKRNIERGTKKSEVAIVLEEGEIVTKPAGK